MITVAVLLTACETLSRIEVENRHFRPFGHDDNDESQNIRLNYLEVSSAAAAIKRPRSKQLDNLLV